MKMVEKWEWKNERIEEILISSICIWLEGWKNGGMKFFFCLVEKKNKRNENRIWIDLSSLNKTKSNTL